MSVTFSGLASGVDTASIVESIMEIERAPITSMEDKQEYLESKLEVYTEFNTLLDSFYSSVIGLNSESDLNSYAITNNGAEYFSITTSLLSDDGSYAVEVVSLAQQQKDISPEGFADTNETTLAGELQIGGETLSYEGVTLLELVDLITEGDNGISASIANTGTENGYRLLLSADSAGEEIEIRGTGSITLDSAVDGHTVEGTKAHLVIDGVDYYSSDNIVTTAIKGATITLLAESDSTTKNVSITSDTENVISEQLAEMVSAYNSINEYIDTIYASDSTLGNSMKTVQRNLKDSLTSLASLGLESNWETGEITFDSDKLAEAYGDDPDSVIELLMGSDDNGGVMTRMDYYLNNQLNSSSGFYATKESGLNTQLSRLDERITTMETRLEKRQETLEKQFAAMELLVSSLNSQSDYLTNFFDSYSSSSS
ncbi:MAG: flagellar filament capping protein FliD [Proteobacteria bacterium]|nr:flagellar filament capping protein FliD [Pseudomonadota bacterium]MBU1139572.1 flagellar filament capping protein FliD [Pseudomonadota bacterium]MBU1233583.1 flagellar filament capping protein FliD [Pseudomonadota bacterium]MBU1420584.1 flagellar filament capping protein FliD [Pseudomonadota bacterium]MBU1454983.1 flagellar filament capping protein FliD [Pseudomonadota bacterium]